MMNTLQAHALKKDFVQGGKRLEVLRDISISFEQGKSYAITGVSGSGKSTLLHVLGGLDHPTHGTVTFNEHDIFKMRKKDAFLNRSIGFVFQFHYLIKELSVLENIMLMGLISGQPKYDCQVRAYDLLKATGMEPKAHAYPGQLSGGEQQRVSVMRAIFNKPVFLLADEPTGNLDSHMAQQLVELFLRSQKEWGMGIILCSHDKDVYQKMETVFTMHDGQLVKGT